MASELIRYATGDVMPVRSERPIARRARKIYDEIRVAGLQADGQVALAGHIMEQVVELDAKRRALAGDDPITNSMLVDVEIHTVRNLKKIQDGVFNAWKL